MCVDGWQWVEGGHSKGPPWRGSGLPRLLERAGGLFSFGSAPLSEFWELLRDVEARTSLGGKLAVAVQGGCWELRVEVI